MIEIDGRSPFSFEVDEHRRAGRFQKHYHRVQAGDGVDREEGFSLAWLTRFPTYEFKGVERFGDGRCYRLAFTPGAVSVQDDVDGRVPRRFLEVMAGSICVDSESFHLRHARARTLRPVPLTFGLVRILGLSVELEGQRISDDVWLPAGIRVESHMSILGRDVRKRNTFSYSDYREVDEESRRSEIREGGLR